MTTRYPKRPDGYDAGFRGVVVTPPPGVSSSEGRSSRDTIRPELEDLCPTGAIERRSGSAGDPGETTAELDRGRCILCGRCVEARPDVFAFSPDTESAAASRRALVVPHAAGDDAELDDLRRHLDRRVRALRRSIHVRHVDAGSDGAEEWEVAALTNPVYDVQRLGIYFTASPRHADVLLVTGVGTSGMAGPLRETYAAMADPKVVVAAGTDATSGGLVHPTYSAGPGVASILPVDVFVPGSPPSPFSLLHGILLGIGILPDRAVRR
ncbi:MAG: ferredoxin [Acidimicrobiales bacterium]